MIAPRAGVRVWIATRPIDFRRGAHDLTALVAQVLPINPYGGDIMVFRSKRSDRIKLLAWDGSGMVLATKWLESVVLYGHQSKTARRACRRPS